MTNCIVNRFADFDEDEHSPKRHPECPIVGETTDYKCFMCEEKEKAYLAGYREGLKAGESALNEGSKDESIN